MESKFVSIILPCLNEEKYIAKVLDAMIHQTYPRENTEIFVVDGGSTDGTRTILQTYIEKNKGLLVLDNKLMTAPHALNLGISKAKGEIIIRIDAHCDYPENYIEVLVQKLHEHNADNVGAVLDTVPGSKLPMARCIAIAMSHPFGVGNSMFRTGIGRDERVDTVPFGCYKREVFDEIGLFDTDLTRNQDDEFNARLIENGGRIVLISSLKVKYFARERLSKAVIMFYQYGFFKPLVNRKLKQPATLRQFVPPLFVLAILFSFLWFFFGYFAPDILLRMLAVAYLIPAVVISIIATEKHRKLYLVFLLPIVFFSLHIAYGVGYLNGYFRFQILKRNNTNVKISR